MLTVKEETAMDMWDIVSCSDAWVLNLKFQVSGTDSLAGLPVFSGIACIFPQQSCWGSMLCLTGWGMPGLSDYGCWLLCLTCWELLGLVGFGIARPGDEWCYPRIPAGKESRQATVTVEYVLSTATGPVGSKWKVAFGDQAGMNRGKYGGTLLKIIFRHEIINSTYCKTPSGLIIQSSYSQQNSVRPR